MLFNIDKIYYSILFKFGKCFSKKNLYPLNIHWICAVKKSAKGVLIMVLPSYKNPRLLWQILHLYKNIVIFDMHYSLV